MTMRAGLVAALILTCVLTCATASAAPSHRRPAAPTRHEPMTFYVVKGAPDACGRGCDSWIEAEGQIVSGTAARLKAFLDRHRDRNMPIYFASPGGNLDQAIVMGNMLHARPTTARVGRTLVRECGFEAQDSDVCIKLKQSGRELHGDLFTGGAICASACPYLLAGAPVHEVAPDAVLGVHSTKVILSFRGGQPDPSVIAAADQRSHERADRMVAAYLARMGIDAGLLGLAKSVRFEDIHVLTRDEIARFGLDRRDFVETPWRFESSGLNMMHKVAFARGPGETSFRLLQWSVTCLDANRFALHFQRPASANPGLTSVSIAGGDSKPAYLISLSARGANVDPKGSSVEQWGVRMLRPALQSLFERPQAEFTETSFAPDGRRAPQTMQLSNDGSAGALRNLLTACPPAKDPVPVQTTRAGETTAK
jgi:hypothetical protein